jgi:glycine/D-amino acid oxidase-like deaminating enzyme/nitrite reductase/ring-hydroxylating ferredoxin subunit
VQNPSLWVATTPVTDFPSLSGEVEVDVAVIGAGITGLSVATLLKRSGVRVAVIEAGHVASGATGYTTAKVTSLHGLTYRHLLNAAGEAQTRQYADANQAAVAQVARVVDELAIDCDFRRAEAVTYTEDPTRVGDIEAEVTAAQQVGLPAGFTQSTDLPYPIAGAIRLPDQAMFHPRKYCLALAAAIPGGGSYLFEQTRAIDVTSGPPCEVVTERGRVRAAHVVLATQIPFLDRGGFFARTHPSRSYALAGRVEGSVPEGMYLSVDTPTRSVRPHHADGETFVIIGGEGHKVGQDTDTRHRHEALEGWARDRFHLHSIDYRWSAQDYMPVDDVPYIGRLTPNDERIFVATGFKKWGMTTGTIAGMILAELIMGRPSPWAEVFDSTRMDVRRSAQQFITENLNVAKRFVGDRVDLVTAPEVSALARGHGGVVEVNGEKVAAFRDDDGALHAVSPHCSHMGCVVTWNTAERTWDCPCHGSRYDIAGRAIQGPTVKDLESKSLPSASIP